MGVFKELGIEVVALFSGVSDPGIMIVSICGWTEEICVDVELGDDATAIDNRMVIKNIEILRINKNIERK